MSYASLDPDLAFSLCVGDLFLSCRCMSSMVLYTHIIYLVLAMTSIFIEAELNQMHCRNSRTERRVVFTALIERYITAWM